jgi:hypothetical protein
MHLPVKLIRRRNIGALQDTQPIEPRHFTKGILQDAYSCLHEGHQASPRFRLVSIMKYSTRF